jgi:hypothetical protein
VHALDGIGPGYGELRHDSGQQGGFQEMERDQVRALAGERGEEGFV